MAITFAFDVYGTLIDPQAIAQKLEGHLGPGFGEGAAVPFARLWRAKQLEYSFRRSLMGAYRDFAHCTRQALDYTCAAEGAELSEEAREELMAQYRRLPAFPEVPGALEDLKERGARLFAFSNGLPADLAALLDHAKLADYFEGVVSVHPVRCFKPHPAVYAHFQAVAGVSAADTWLVSGNPFDVLGARASGWQAAWLQRDPAVPFDPWELKPSRVIDSLAKLGDLVLTGDPID